MFKLDLEKAEEPQSNCQHLLDHRKSKRIPVKHLLLLYWLCKSFWLCGLQQTVENSSRGGNTRPPYLPPGKSVCRSSSSNPLATWCKELIHWKRPWSWERLKAGGEGEDRGWDDWMASLTLWTRVWESSRSWWWTGKPGVLQSMGLQRVRLDWATLKIKRNGMGE